MARLHRYAAETWDTVRWCYLREKWSICYLVAIVAVCAATLLMVMTGQYSRFVVLDMNPGAAAGLVAIGMLFRPSSNPDPKVRIHIASTHCRPKTLVALSRDGNPGIRLAAAGNPALPARQFAELLQDRDQQVRSRALANPSCPRYLLAFVELAGTP